MSLFKNLVATYDALGDSDFVYEMPIAHMKSRVNILVTLDGDGRFRRAERFGLKDMPSVTMPCTIDSASRSGLAIFPHPLYDTLEYLSTSEPKQVAYLQGLSAWKSDNVKLNSIYTYVESGTLLADLTMEGIDYKEKDFVQFRVEVKGDAPSDLSKDKVIITQWIDTYTRSKAFKKREICYISGEIDNITSKHPKGTNVNANSSVLVSTELSRIRDRNSISYLASQKAHAMLRYLVREHGLKTSTGVIVAWSVGGIEPPPSHHQDSIQSCDDFGNFYGEDTAEPPHVADIVDINYAQRFSKALQGYTNAKKLNEHHNKIAIVALDAATTGRMSITYYQELGAHEYLEKLANWHDQCQWHKVYKNKEDKWRTCISAPSVDEIIRLAYGDTKGDSYYKIQKRQREQLVANIFSGKPMDSGFIQSAFRRLSNPFSFQNKDGDFSEASWRNNINTLCSVYRMYSIQKKGQVYQVALQHDKIDRSYLYGRLLAIAEKIENHAMHKKNKQGSRTTIALRYTQGFVQNPDKTWLVIHNQLIPYKQQLTPGSLNYYEDLIGQIMSLLAQVEPTAQKGLEPSYLMGYSLQRLELNRKHDTTEPDDDQGDQTHE